MRQKLIVSHADAALDAEMAGPKSAPVIALGHNFATDRDIWAAQLEALGKYRVLRWDMRGHGQSSLPAASFSLRDMACDVVAILDAFQIEQCHYCGVSMGGMVGQHLALNAPQRVASLALVNTTSAYDDAQRNAWDQRIARVMNEGIDALHDELMARWFTPASLQANLPGVQHMSESYRRFSSAAFQACAASVRDIDTTQRLPQIDQPTLIIAGADDPATPPTMSELMHQRIAGSRYHVIADAAHLSQVEQPVQFNRLLCDFLADVAS